MLEQTVYLEYIGIIEFSHHMLHLFIGYCVKICVIFITRGVAECNTVHFEVYLHWNSFSPTGTTMGNSC